MLLVSEAVITLFFFPMQTLISSDLFIEFLNVFFNCLILVTFACYFAMLHETPCNFTLLLI